jgi:carboxyl-terminal processing protease
VKAPKPESEQDQKKKREPPAEFGSSEDLLLTQALKYFKSHPSTTKKSAAQATN